MSSCFKLPCSLECQLHFIAVFGCMLKRVDNLISRRTRASLLSSEHWPFPGVDDVAGLSTHVSTLSSIFHSCSYSYSLLPLYAEVVVL